MGLFSPEDYEKLRTEAWGYYYNNELWPAGSTVIPQGNLFDANDKNGMSCVLRYAGTRLNLEKPKAIFSLGLIRKLHYVLWRLCTPMFYSRDTTYPYYGENYINAFERKDAVVVKVDEDKKIMTLRIDGGITNPLNYVGLLKNTSCPNQYYGVRVSIQPGMFYSPRDDDNCVAKGRGVGMIKKILAVRVVEDLYEVDVECDKVFSIKALTKIRGTYEEYLPYARITIWRIADPPKFHPKAYLHRLHGDPRVCINSRIDYSNSPGLAKGKGQFYSKDDGRYYYCAMRYYTEEKQTVVDGFTQCSGVELSASRAADFVPACRHADCNKYQPVGDFGFDYKRDAGSIINRLIMNADFVAYARQDGGNIVFYDVRRLGAPSFYWLTDAINCVLDSVIPPLEGGTLRKPVILTGWSAITGYSIITESDNSKRIKLQRGFAHVIDESGDAIPRLGVVVRSMQSQASESLNSLPPEFDRSRLLDGEKIWPNDGDRFITYATQRLKNDGMNCICCVPDGPGVAFSPRVRNDISIVVPDIWGVAGISGQTALTEAVVDTASGYLIINFRPLTMQGKSTEYIIASRIASKYFSSDALFGILPSDEVIAWGNRYFGLDFKHEPRTQAYKDPTTNAWVQNEYYCGGGPGFNPPDFARFIQGVDMNASVGPTTGGVRPLTLMKIDQGFLGQEFRAIVLYAAAFGSPDMELNSGTIGAVNSSPKFSDFCYYKDIAYCVTDQPDLLAALRTALDAGNYPTCTFSLGGVAFYPKPSVQCIAKTLDGNIVDISSACLVEACWNRIRIKISDLENAGLTRDKRVDLKIT